MEELNLSLINEKPYYNVLFISFISVMVTSVKFLNSDPVKDKDAQITGGGGKSLLIRAIHVNSKGSVWPHNP